MSTVAVEAMHVARLPLLVLLPQPRPLRLLHLQLTSSLLQAAYTHLIRASSLVIHLCTCRKLPCSPVRCCCCSRLFLLLLLFCLKLLQLATVLSLQGDVCSTSSSHHDNGSRSNSHSISELFS